MATQVTMGFQYGSRSTELASLFDCACGVLEHEVGYFKSVSVVDSHPTTVKVYMKVFRSSSWHVSQGIERQQTTLLEHIANSQETALNISNELAAQRNSIQENSSWAQRLNTLLSGWVVDPAQTSKNGMLSLPQLFVASGYHSRESS